MFSVTALFGPAAAQGDFIVIRYEGPKGGPGILVAEWYRFVRFLGLFITVTHPKKHALSILNVTIGIISINMIISKYFNYSYSYDMVTGLPKVCARC